MTVTFSLEEIYGKNPKAVARLFRKRGLNPARPYNARINFSGVVIQQD
jgi:hypothetical protein